MVVVVSVDVVVGVEVCGVAVGGSAVGVVVDVEVDVVGSDSCGGLSVVSTSPTGVVVVVGSPWPGSALQPAIATKTATAKRRTWRRCIAYAPVAPSSPLPSLVEAVVASLVTVTSTVDVKVSEWISASPASYHVYVERISTT